MTLAALMGRYPDELRADLQQYYGICIDDVGTKFSVEHLACLAAQLPLQSRTLSAVDPDNCWDLSAILQACLINQFNDYIWGKATANAKAAKKRPPEQIPHIGTKAMRETNSKKHTNKITGNAMPLDEFKKQLERMRG